MLLALDTATRYLSLALHDGQTLIAEQTHRTGNKQNTLLAPFIADMMALCGVEQSDLTAVAVTRGPGSYTGLRIGVALAKGIASIAQLPLIGVSTLDMLAAGQPFQNTGYHLLAIIPAGRGRIVAGEYRVKKGRWEAKDEPQYSTWDELLPTLEGSYYVTGEIDDTGFAAIAHAKAESASLTVLNGANRLRRAGFLAQEAWRRYHDGEPDDFAPAKLLPMYINPVS